MASENLLGCIPDLEDAALVDRDGVAFLARWEGEGIGLEHTVGRMSASGFKKNEKVSVGENGERFVCS